MILKCFSVCECKSAAACLPMLTTLPSFGRDTPLSLRKLNVIIKHGII